MNTQEVTFNVGPCQVYEVAARDEMHPSRTVNNTYLKPWSGQEVHVGSNAFAHGLTLTREVAVRKVEAWLRRQEASRG